jgi:hypothetical protein
MAERKETPDVLADILGADVPAPDLGTPLPIGRITELPPRRPAPRRSAQQATKPQSKPLAEPARPAATPPAWIYETVSFQDAHGWRPRYINGKEVRNWMGGPLLHDYVNQRGNDGWELVAAAAGQSLYGTSDRYQLYIRRPQH